MVKNFLAWLIYLTPFLGSVVMLWEAAKGKELTGTVLTGTQKMVHFLFGLASLILDFLLAGVGGSISRGVFKVLGKGFLRRGAVVGARMAGRGVTRTGLRAVGRVLTSMSGHWAGRMVINSTEKNIRKKVEHTLGKVHGYRIDSKKRKELQGQFATRLHNRNDVVAAQRAAKQEKALQKQSQNAAQSNELPLAA